MNKLQNNILDISHNYYNYLMSLKNVIGVGMGFKYINSINIEEPCIHVLVENKFDSKYISKNNLIPKRYMGIKTDVIETKRFRASSGNVIPYKLRPLQSGCNISIKGKNSSGTLSCIVTKGNIFKKEYFILSNNHVIADCNKAPIGIPIVQPGSPSGGIGEIAYLETFVQLKFIEYSKKPVNYMDAAIAKISNKSLVQNRIFSVGKIKGTSEASLGSSVGKAGFATGITYGKIETIGLTIEIDYSNNQLFKELVLFKNQIRAQIQTTLGDSGSLVFDENRKAIGIQCGATGNNNALINDINMVLKELEVNIYT